MKFQHNFRNKHRASVLTRVRAVKGIVPSNRVLLIRCFSFFYFVAIVLVIAGLLAEVIFAIDYRKRMEVARNFRETSFFSQRQVTEAFADSLWLRPWEAYRPSSELRLKDDGMHLEVVINEHGFRTPSFAIPKPDNVVRVIAIGGSTTVQGLSNERTYPAYLDDMLNERFPNESIEVINLGVSGTKSDHWLKRIDKLLSYQPDIVIQYNGINDITWEHMRHLAQRQPIKKALNKSHMYEYFGLMDLGSFDRYFMRTLSNFDKMRNALEQNGIAYISGSFAVPSYDAADSSFQSYLDFDARAWGKNFGLRYYETLHRIIKRYNKMYKRFVVHKNITAVAIDEAIFDPRYFIDSCHMTDEGIVRLASLFAEPVSEAIVHSRSETG